MEIQKKTGFGQRFYQRFCLSLVITLLGVLLFASFSAYYSTLAAQIQNEREQSAAWTAYKQRIEEEAVYGFDTETYEHESGDNPGLLLDDNHEMPPPADASSPSSSRTALGAPPPYIDLSQSIYFPAIGNQGALGSCAAWATTYYAFTYQVNRLHGTAANSNDRIYSPKWSYNMVNKGVDDGSNNYTIITSVLKHQGAATWNEFPYQSSAYPATNYTEWPANPAVYRNALKTRASNYGSISIPSVSNYNDTTLDEAKTRLASGQPFILSTYIRSWQSTSVAGYGAVAYNCVGQNGSHAMAVIGYDDNLILNIAGGTTRGAFKVANSWGTDYGNSGFIWLTYDALNKVSTIPGLNVSGRISVMQVGTLEYMEVKDYSPSLTAEITMTSNARNNIHIQLGKETANGAFSTIDTLFNMWLTLYSGSLSFAGTTAASTATFVFDFTALASEIPEYSWRIGLRNIGSPGITSVSMIRFIQNTAQLQSHPGSTLSSTFAYYILPTQRNMSLSAAPVFPNEAVGYSQPAAQSVTITNTGGAATGSLSIEVSGAGAAFQTSLTQAGVYNTFAKTTSSIPILGSLTFWVRPATGRAAGNYSSTVTVKASNMSRSLIVSFSVIQRNISLSFTGAHTFAAAPAGDSAYTPAAHNVTVSNTASIGTGALTVGLAGTGASAFRLSTTTIPNLANFSNSAVFSVQPQNNLGAGTYNATVTVSGANLTARSFSVSFTVIQRSITLSQTSSYPFGTTYAGDGTAAPSARSVTVTNSAPIGTGVLTVGVAGTGAAAFRLSTMSIPNIANQNGTAVFTVQPQNNLNAGIYNATVTVSGNNLTAQSFTVTFNVAELTPISSVAINVEVPVIGGIPSDILPSETEFRCTSVAWSPDSDTFLEDTEYTVTYTLAAQFGFIFAETQDLTTAVNGADAAIVNRTAAELILSYQFENTGLSPVISISIVSEPSVLQYVTGDLLDLSGLSVELTYRNNKTETIPAKDFAGNAITTAPAAGTPLNVTDYNAKPIKVLFAAFEDSTENLTVLKGNRTSYDIPTVTGTVWNASLVLSDIELPSPWVWEEPETQLTAGENSHLAILPGGSNYFDVSQSLEFEIEKGAPQIPELTEVTLVSGMRLGDIPLPEGWIWKDPDTVIESIGEQTYEAVFAGDNNQKTAESILSFTILEPSAPEPELEKNLGERLLPLWILGAVSAVLTVFMYPKRKRKANTVKSTKTK